MRSASPQTREAEPRAQYLLIQVAAKEPLEVLRLANRAGSGLVFTGGGAIEVAAALRRQGWTCPILADRRRYAGPARIRGTASFSQAWLAGQRDAGVTPVLTDSGYIGGGDVAALRAVLRQAAQAGPDVTAVLPLHEAWLREDASSLIAEVAEHEAPVAVVVEHAGEPLATPEAVAGLVELLRSVPSVGLLGTGIAGLGALAFGARWAAVGVRSSLRAFPPAGYDEGRPAGKRRWRRGPQEIVAAPVLSFMPVHMVVSGYAASAGNPAWACRCATCHRRTPEWLVSAAPLDADAHTFDVLLGVADRLRRRQPGFAREQAWRNQCQRALGRYAELGLAALGWPPPVVMTAWATAGLAGRASRAAATRARPLRSAG